MKVETTALSIKHIAQMYCVNGKYFADLYRNKISDYADWCEEELSGGFYFNAANIGPYMSLDETCLSNGEVWTFLTNKDGRGGRGTLAAAIPGTKSDEIISILIGAMGKSLRRRVKEVTCDLSPSMMLIAAEVFYNAHVVNDRFHVQKVYNDVLTRSASTSAGSLSPKTTAVTNQSLRLHTQTVRLCARYLRAASTRL